MGGLSSRLSCLPFSNTSSLWRRLDKLKYCGLGRYNQMVVVSYYQRHAGLVLVYRLVGLNLPKNSVNGVTDRLDITLDFDWAVKPQQKQTNSIIYQSFDTRIQI